MPENKVSSKNIILYFIVGIGSFVIGLLVIAIVSDERLPRSDQELNVNQNNNISRASSGTLQLPERAGEKRLTTGTVPHIQQDAEPVDEVDAELRRRAFLFPGVEDQPSDRSLPGARGITFSSTSQLQRPDVIAGSDEFAVIHPDGSLHVWLPVDSANEVDLKKWGEIHPWAQRDGFWDGVVMVFTPESMEELEITMQILVDAYNFITGSFLTTQDVT